MMNVAGVIALLLSGALAYSLWMRTLWFRHEYDHVPSFAPPQFQGEVYRPNRLIVTGYKNPLLRIECETWRSITSGRYTSRGVTLFFVVLGSISLAPLILWSATLAVLHLGKRPAKAGQA